jgi:hypothetical protein
MPLRVYLQILEIKCEGKAIQKGNYIVWSEIRPCAIPFTSKCAFDSRKGTLSCADFVELAAGCRYGSLMSILLKTNNAASTEIARTHLPLDWFPSDQVCTDWFPMKAVPAYPNGLMVQITTHIIKRFPLPPFSAPPGRLLVLPAWPRPNKPVVPPTPYFSLKPPGWEIVTVPQAPYPGGGKPPKRPPPADQKPPEAQKHGAPPAAAPPRPHYPPPQYPPPQYPPPQYPPPQQPTQPAHHPGPTAYAPPQYPPAPSYPQPQYPPGPPAYPPDVSARKAGQAQPPRPAAEDQPYFLSPEEYCQVDPSDPYSVPPVDTFTNRPLPEYPRID